MVELFKREYGYPVLNVNNTMIVKDEKKAEILTKTFSKTHSTVNISEDGRKGKELTN